MPVPVRERVTALERLTTAVRTFQGDFPNLYSEISSKSLLHDGIDELDSALEEAERVLAASRDLTVTVDVGIVKTPRRTCPRCRNVRVLYGLAAIGTVQAGSDLLCGECGGLRA